MKPAKPKDVAAIMLDGTSIPEALRQARISVLTRHKKLGYPIVVWSNGKVVLIPPEEIKIPESEADNR